MCEKNLKSVGAVALSGGWVQKNLKNALALLPLGSGWVEKKKKYFRRFVASDN